MKNDKADGYWLGFDLGGTKMVAELFDAGFAAVVRTKKRTRPEDGPVSGLDRIVRQIRATLAEGKVRPAQLRGIGIGCAGPADLSRGVILDLVNLGWRNVPIKSKLERSFGCPVAVINDVDAGIYGEYRFGAARGARCALGIFVGTGIGGGCVYDGAILRGKRSSCMEIGHMCVIPGGPLCGCGRRGCLEAVAGRLAIAAAAAAAACRGAAPHLRDETGTDVADMKSGALAFAIRAGDSAVEQIVRGAAGWIGFAAANAVNLLAPDIVVLGGGLVQAMPRLFTAEAARAARRHVVPAYERAFKMAPAALGDEATVMGAAAWVEKSCSGVGRSRKS